MTILIADDFDPKEGVGFQMIFDEGDALDLILKSIRRHKVQDFPGKTRDPFSLFFEGTRGVHCPQGIYRLRDGTGWEVDVFLVPIGVNQEGLYTYQAVFN